MVMYPRLSVLTLPSDPAFVAARHGRRIHSEDVLALALSRRVHGEVPVIDAHLQDAPAGRFLIAFPADIEIALNSCPVERRAAIASRTVDMDAKWPNLFKLLERYKLAAAVDLRRYWAWERQPDNDFGGGIYGLISVAERAGMAYESGRSYGSEHYGQLACRDHCRDLPSLLAHYLTVYEEMGLHKRSGSD